MTPNRQPLPSRARYHRQNPCHAFESFQSCRSSRSADAMMYRLTSRRTRLLRGPFAAANGRQKSACPRKASAAGLFPNELKAAFLRLSVSRTACSARRLEDIGATLGHDETILHSHIFVIASDARFRARGINSCPCDQLLGK